VHGGLGFYQGDGTTIATYSTGITLKDCCAFRSWTPHTNTFGLLGADPASSIPATLAFWGEISYELSDYQQAVFDSGTVGSGVGKLNYASVKGVGGLNDHSMVILEGAPEYSVERWRIDGTSTQYLNKVINGHGDADNQFNNPLDITTDPDNNVFVLDILSNGQPRIKMFTSDLESVGGVGDSTLIPGTPVRFDWDDGNDGVHILTTTGVVVLTK